MAVEITVSSVLADLKAGLTRKEIGLKHGLNGVQLKGLFNHPKLKNRKTVKEKGAAFTLVDDVPDVTVSAHTTVPPVIEVVQEQVVEEVVESVTNDEVQGVVAEDEAEEILWNNDTK